MSDPYWPWWAVITFLMSGAFSAWVLTASRRPSRVGCPMCGHDVPVRKLREHWKACEQ